MKTALEQVLEITKTQTELARRLGVSAQAVQQWYEKGEIPARRAIQVEHAIGGHVKAADLCPSVFRGI